jgi:hypothetical protein
MADAQEGGQPKPKASSPAIYLVNARPTNEGPRLPREKWLSYLVYYETADLDIFNKGTKPAPADMVQLAEKGYVTWEGDWFGVCKPIASTTS